MIRKLSFNHTLKKGGATGWYIDLTLPRLHKTSKVLAIVNTHLLCVDCVPLAVLWSVDDSDQPAGRPSHRELVETPGWGRMGLY